MRRFKLAIPKIRMTPSLLWFAYRFIDLEAGGETAECTGRTIEYPFVLAKLAQRKPSKVLDVGCTSSVNLLPGALIRMGWEVYGIDLREWNLRSPGFHFVKGDVRKTDFPDAFFDHAYDVSAIEHIGIAGRYGIAADDPEGDVKEMREVFRVLRPGGSFIVTLPYDVEYRIIEPKGRVYDDNAVSRLFAGWETRDREVWILNEEGVWLCPSDDALAVQKHKEGLLLAELVKPEP